MKAVRIEQYGGPEVVRVDEVARPTVGPGEILVRVRAASVNPIDWQLRSGALKAFMPKKFPLVLGVDLAGEVVEVAAGSRFAIGDPVVASMPGDTGAFAEFVAVPEKVAARKPANTSFVEAGSLPATAMTALQALRDKAHLREGQSVLVNGASGGVGIFGVQLAKALGAGTVTAVCGARSFEMVKGLGADRLIDYRATDFTKEGGAYDVILDCVHQHSFAACRPVMAKTGVHVGLSPKNWPAAYFRQYVLNRFASQKAYVMMMTPNSDDLAFIASLVEAGRVRTVIDKVFPLASVLEAEAYSETGRAQGKIVLEFPS